MTTFDKITRFLYSSRKYNRTRVNLTAFMPYELKTSVYSIDGLSPDEIWEIGKRFCSPGERKLHGRGDLPSAFIDKDIKELSLDRNDNPPRHADIIDWPDKVLIQQQLALKLADRCGTPLLVR